MKNGDHCQCQSECKTKRCACLKAGRPCGSQCKCQNCSNPFNSIENPDQLSDCARDNIKKIATISAINLEKLYELPCRCAPVPLKSLLEDYECQSCDEPYYYSFCLGEVMDTNSMWHCQICRTCSDDGVWHCKNCNRCTYGLTLSCEHCGKRSSYRSRGK